MSIPTNKAISAVTYNGVNIPLTGIAPSGTKNITQAGDTDVTNYATAHVDAGSVAAPTASKGAVSNHSVAVTPSVEYSAGLIAGGSKSGNAVSVSAAELVSGTKDIDANGTGIDVTNYQKVNVNVPTPAPNLQNKTVTSNGQVTADAGYDGLGTVTVNVQGGGGIPEPSPISAGNTPVYSVYETHVATGNSATTCYSYTAKKAGTYRIKLSLTASNNNVTAQIRVNNVNKKAATWTRSGSISSSYYCDLSVDVALAVGDVVTCYLLAGSSSRGVVAHAMDVCINWDNTF